MIQKTADSTTTLSIDPTISPAAKLFSRGAGAARRHAKFFVNFLYMCAGFALGLCAMPYGTHPCGTALICAAQKYRLFSYIGACLSAVLTENAASTVAVNTLVFFLFCFLEGRGKKHFTDNLRSRVIISCVAGVLYGCGLAYAGAFETEPLLSGASVALFLPATTLCISHALSGLRKNTAVIDGAYCTACVLFTYAMSSLGMQGFYPASAFAALFTLIAASCGGSLYGILFGAVCGIASGGFLQGAEQAVCFSAAGGICGLFAKEKKAVAALSFFMAFFASAAYFDFPELFDISLSSAAGCAVFPAISSLLPRMAVKDSAMHSAKGSKNPPWEHLSAAFSSLSDMVYNVSDKLRYPSYTETGDCVDKVTAYVCGSCAMRENCYAAKLYSLENIRDTVCTRLSSGGLNKSDYPPKYAESCIRLCEMTEKLNESYAELVQSRFRDSKTEILAAEYSTMARLFKYTSQKTKTDITPDNALRDAAISALSAIGLRFSSVEAYGVRIKTVEVHGIKLENFPCTSEELANYMSEKCGYLFAVPEYIGMGEKMTARFIRKRKFKPEYARSMCAKGGEGVCGDSVNFFESDELYFYALISDGMGSGRSAALTSRLTSVFIEKLLTTGAHKSVTLEMLNNLLLSKNDESFATVDLLEIDLLTGDASFVKAGAAPAYILRASKLYRIASHTPPAGIIRSFNAENTRFSLSPGDTVLMLSDGIVQSSDDAPWLCEMLNCASGDTPSALAEKVLAKARRINQREDDMTCVAVRVE